jgi:uncharacterized Zn-binding protein involved in type VI secretion
MTAVARLNDTSDHGGKIITASSNVLCDSIPVARDGDTHSCPIVGHGDTAITAITTHSYVNGRLILTVGARAGCGALINSGSPTTNVE